MMKTYARNPKDLELLACINQHDRLAGALGILPNHLIQLLRLTHSENLDKIIDDLRFTTFWSTYNIWTKHQRLKRTYWKIIPECCKVKEKKSEPLIQKPKRQRKKKNTFEDCKNPFHYLLLKKNSQPIQGTCSCSTYLDRRRKKDITFDSKTILDFHQPSPPLSLSSISKKPLDNKNKGIIDDITGLDHKHTPANKRTITQILHTKTSGEISREHDQTKRFKQRWRYVCDRDQ